MRGSSPLRPAGRSLRGAGAVMIRVPTIRGRGRGVRSESEMLTGSKAFSGFAVRDADAAKRFYGEVLGQDIADYDAEHGLLELKLAGGTTVLVYTSPTHEPGNYTILNFPVDDIDAAVDALAERGVEFERYDGMPQDEKGVMRAGGPYIAWFKDPSGNTLSILQER
jgi:predicted enzyme related to lactoylglutathione lyase